MAGDYILVWGNMDEASTHTHTHPYTHTLLNTFNDGMIMNQTCGSISTLAIIMWKYAVGSTRISRIAPRTDS